MKKSRYNFFIQNIVQDALLFIFLLLVLSVFRALFLMVFAQALEPDTSRADIALTMWYGLRIGLKTAGACVLPSFVFATLLQAIWPKWNGVAVRLGWACFVFLFLSLLFQMRVPYYREFHTAFSPFIFNTFHDDVGAIVSTSITQYNAVWRTLGGIACAALLIGIFRSLLKYCTAVLIRPFLAVRRPCVVVIIICILLVPFAVFVRKGGAFSFHQSIYWKNAARFNQHLLNEAVLDDVQALYRASRLYKKLRKNAVQINVEDVRAAAARLTGQREYTEESLLPLFKRQASGISGKKPKHIFVIIGETYMMWPLMDEYQKYPLAQGMRRLLKRPDAVLLKSFLPASNGTMFGLTSVILGIPELNLHASSRPTAQTPYETALSVQLKQQGYKTRFLYGGFPSWDDVETFVKHQGFDESFYAANFGGVATVWGVPDRDFLQGIDAFIGPEPSLNVILTSSNHPPYRVDMNRESDLPTVTDFAGMLPVNTADKDLVASRMWHFAYADKYLTEFIEAMLAKYPDSLFVITGDHADRWTIASTPSDYERIAVPLIVIDPRSKNKSLPQDLAGSHMDIAATVLEKVLAKGTSYYALGHHVFDPKEIPLGVAAYYWITPQEMGSMTGTSTALPGASNNLSEQDRVRLRQRVKDIQTIAAWRVLNGTALTL
ncbi:MAG: LTA synthase family protein [Elusimicrobiaceae bacterium]|nr:LTA synthase family protein [Elusimicrobiaceae bacterium]